MNSIPVLIVGGGPVGLSLALALSRQNVHSVVLERNSSTTQHPRARGVNVRTMELFKQWGNHNELLQFEQPKESWRIIWSESFQGTEVTRVEAYSSDSINVTPAVRSLVCQDRVEKSLYHTLLKHKEAKVQFLKELISFEEDEHGITARILNKETGGIEFLHTQYLIAADGAHSKLRSQLGITMQGPDNLGMFCNVYCKIDIREWTKHRPCVGYFFTDLQLSGRWLASIDGDKLWVIGMSFSKGMTKEIFTDEYCISEIQRVVGLPNLEVNILNKSFWTMAAQLANQYRKNRAFLVGDAAHRLPPSGGFGMNTGIQDAHNLAWKLAFVINYNVSEKLLDTYYIERAPIAKQNIEWSTENAKSYTELYTAIHTGDIELQKIKLSEQQRNLNSLGLDLGFIYHSAAINSENTQKLSITPAKYVPTTLPGSRAPHINLIKDGKIISTLDLFEKEFVLLIGSDGRQWRIVADKLSKTLPFPLNIYCIANDGDLTDPDNAWYETYEVTKTGAVLVRPDGHVAWRCKSLASDKDSKTTELEKYFDLLIA